MFGLFGKKAPLPMPTEPVHYRVHKNYGVDRFPYSWGMHFQRKYGPEYGFSDVIIIQSYHPDLCLALTGALLTTDGVDLKKLEQHSRSDLRLVLVYYGHTEKPVVNLIDPVLHFSNEGRAIPNIVNTCNNIDPVRIHDKSHKFLYNIGHENCKELSGPEVWDIFQSIIK